MHWYRVTTAAAVLAGIGLLGGAAPRQASPRATLVECPSFELVEQEITVTPDQVHTFSLDADGKSRIQFQRGAVSDTSRYAITRVPGSAGFAISPVGNSTTTFSRDVHIHIYWGKCSAENGDKDLFIAWDKPGNGVWERAPGNQGSGALVRHVRVRSFTAFAIAT